MGNMTTDGLRIDRSIVLLASERSGGNLLREVLGSHSQVFAPSPVHFLIGIDPLLPLYGDLSDDASFREACHDVSRFFQFQIAGHAEPPEPDALFENARERSLIGLMDVGFRLVIRSSKRANVRGGRANTSASP